MNRERSSKLRLSRFLQGPGCLSFGKHRLFSLRGNTAIRGRIFNVCITNFLHSSPETATFSVTRKIIKIIGPQPTLTPPPRPRSFCESIWHKFGVRKGTVGAAAGSLGAAWAQSSARSAPPHKTAAEVGASAAQQVAGQSASSGAATTRALLCGGQSGSAAKLRADQHFDASCLSGGVSIAGSAVRPCGQQLMHSSHHPEGNGIFR